MYRRTGNLAGNLCRLIFDHLQEKLSQALMQPMISCRQGILERCLRRLEWERVQEREAAAAASQAEAERLAMQAIDWCALVTLWLLATALTFTTMMMQQCCSTADLDVDHSPWQAASTW